MPKGFKNHKRTEMHVVNPDVAEIDINRIVKGNHLVISS
jgi:hypothetical protein